MSNPHKNAYQGRCIGGDHAGMDLDHYQTECSFTGDLSNIDPIYAEMSASEAASVATITGHATAQRYIHSSVLGVSVGCGSLEVHFWVHESLIGDDKETTFKNLYGNILGVYSAALGKVEPAKLN